MKVLKLILVSSFLILNANLQAYSQSINLPDCQKLARENYPLLKQYGLIEKTEAYNISNVNKAYLPQLNFTAKATYQSDITEIPASLGQAISQITGKPFSFPSLSKDQYQAALDVSQLIWDGGQISAQKKSIKANSTAEKQKLEVDLYALNERINNLYFGIMLINEQLKQLNILQDELLTNSKKVEALKANGIAQQADVDAVKVEQINVSQKITEFETMRKSYLQILSAFTGNEISENTTFEKPVLPETATLTENKRPELQLFDLQSKALDSQRSAIYASNMPKLGAFVQGGYGRPGLNMFTSEFSTYYIGGLRLTWNLSGFYSQKNNLNKVETGKKNVDILKETFVFNNNLMTKQQQNDVEKLKLTLKNDNEIILLRNNIKRAAEAKLTNGTISVTDLLREINAENIARQTKAMHEIQLFSTIYQLKYITNN